MTQGIFIAGKRPASKKQIKEAIAENPHLVSIEATSLFGNDYQGPVEGLRPGQTVYFVGPDPQTSRKFYGTICKSGERIVVS